MEPEKNNTPAKIPIPPNVGMLLLWAFRSLGSSVSILNFAILIIDGIIKYVKMNAVKKLSTNL